MSICSSSRILRPAAGLIRVWTQEPSDGAGVKPLIGVVEPGRIIPVVRREFVSVVGGGGGFRAVGEVFGAADVGAQTVHRFYFPTPEVFLCGGGDQMPNSAAIHASRVDAQSLVAVVEVDLLCPVGFSDVDALVVCGVAVLVVAG